MGTRVYRAQYNPFPPLLRPPPLHGETRLNSCSLHRALMTSSIGAPAAPSVFSKLIIGTSIFFFNRSKKMTKKKKKLLVGVRKLECGLGSSVGGFVEIAAAGGNTTVTQVYLGRTVQPSRPPAHVWTVRRPAALTVIVPPEYNFTGFPLHWWFPLQRILSRQNYSLICHFLDSSLRQAVLRLAAPGPCGHNRVSPGMAACGMATATQVTATQPGHGHPQKIPIWIHARQKCNA